MNQKINYNFQNPKLLEEALTHRSFSSKSSNERMEFLGDAILELVITEYIYKHYTGLQEGELAKIRADVVCSASLAKVADTLNLSQYLILGNSEKPSEAGAKPSILADAVEAVIAAVYLDGGLSAVEPLILSWLQDAIEDAAKSPGEADYKTRLQELAVKKLDEVPEYEIFSKGPDHSKFFYASVTVSNNKLGEGTGRTKKEAAQKAAMQAYELLKNEKQGANK